MVKQICFNKIQISQDEDDLKVALELISNA